MAPPPPPPPLLGLVEDDAVPLPPLATVASAPRLAKSSVEQKLPMKGSDIFSLAA